MTADAIRRSFVTPELEAIEQNGGAIEPARVLTLATWEVAAQLAELNEILRSGDANVNASLYATGNSIPVTVRES